MDARALDNLQLDIHRNHDSYIFGEDKMTSSTAALDSVASIPYLGSIITTIFFILLLSYILLKWKPGWSPPDD